MNSILSIAEENYSVLKPTAVIFNLGVNDPGNMYDYISYYQEIAESLQKKNCKLFFMSVNPVNSKTIEYLGKNAIRKEEVIRSRFQNGIILFCNRKNRIHSLRLQPFKALSLFVYKINILVRMQSEKKKNPQIQFCCG